jgi:dolichol kinase
MKNNIEKKRHSFIFKKRLSFLKIATILCFFMIFTFEFDINNVQWKWQDNLMIPSIFGIAAIIFGLLWNLEIKKLDI